MGKAVARRAARPSGKQRLRRQVVQLDEVVRHIKANRGVTGKIAVACGITRQAVCLWRRVPIERVTIVAKITGIPRHRIRPDYPDLFPPPSSARSDDEEKRERRRALSFRVGAEA